MTHYGIKGMSALSHVNFACGIPWEFIHLLYENVYGEKLYPTLERKVQRAR